MAKPTADEFIAALRECEDAGRVDALAALYADDRREHADVPPTGTPAY